MTETYAPKHRGEPKAPTYPSRPKHRAVDLCTACGKRPVMTEGSQGIGGALCLVCYYDL